MNVTHFHGETGLRVLKLQIALVVYELSESITSNVVNVHTSLRIFHMPVGAVQNWRLFSLTGLLLPVHVLTVQEWSTGLNF